MPTKRQINKSSASQNAPAQAGSTNERSLEQADSVSRYGSVQYDVQRRTNKQSQARHYSQAQASCGAQSYARVLPARSTEKSHHRKAGVSGIILVISSFVLVICLCALGAIFYGYYTGQKNYEDLAASVVSDTDGEMGISIDWNALYAINSDIVAWIYIPGTNINYPVCYSGDDSTYLTKSFGGSTNSIPALPTYGCIFLSGVNRGDFSDANNILYGHHLNNGTMFAAIADFGDADLFNSSRTIYLLTPETDYKLKTFAIVKCSMYAGYVQANFSTEDARFSYLQDKVDSSEVAASDIVDVEDMSKTFALSTCDAADNTYRWVLYAYVEQTSEGTGSEELISTIDSKVLNDTLEEVTS